MTRVLVLFGGRSAEHEISILSARFVASALEGAGFEVLLVGIAPDGRWHRLGEMPAGDARSIAIDATAPTCVLPPIPAASPRLLPLDGGAPAPFDVVFPVLHGPRGEDGGIQGVLELAEVPFVGSGVRASAVGMDKAVQKKLLAAAGIDVVPFCALRQGDDARAACEALGLPLFVKPANMGSSLGISRVLEWEGLPAALDEAFRFDEEVVVERGLDRPRELECAVLGGESVQVSSVGEIAVRHADGFYSYDAKYLDPDGATLSIPAPLDATTAARVANLAGDTFAALRLEGLARVDLFLDPGGALYVNEVNTMPGFTSISMFPALWSHAGIEGPELVRILVEEAQARHQRRSALRSTR